MSYTIEIRIKIKWIIKDFPWYGFGEDKTLYNLRTNRAVKQSYNSGSIGYWIDRKFFTLKSLRAKLIKCQMDNKYLYE